MTAITPCQVTRLHPVIVTSVHTWHHTITRRPPAPTRPSPVPPTQHQGANVHGHGHDPATSHAAPSLAPPGHREQAKSAGEVAGRSGHQPKRRSSSHAPAIRPPRSVAVTCTARSRALHPQVAQPAALSRRVTYGERQYPQAASAVGARTDPRRHHQPDQVRPARHATVNTSRVPRPVTRRCTHQPCAGSPCLRPAPLMAARSHQRSAGAKIERSPAPRGQQEPSGHPHRSRGSRLHRSGVTHDPTVKVIARVSPKVGVRTCPGRPHLRSGVCTRRHAPDPVSPAQGEPGKATEQVIPIPHRSLGTAHHRSCVPRNPAVVISSLGRHQQVCTRHHASDLVSPSQVIPHRSLGGVCHRSGVPRNPTAVVSSLRRHRQVGTGKCQVMIAARCRVMMAAW